MQTKHFGLILFLIFFTSLPAICQHSNERYPLEDVKNNQDISIYAGATSFLGDLGGTKGKGESFIKDFNAKALRSAVGLSYGYYPGNWYKVSANLNFTSIAGADSLIKERTNGPSMGRYMRNLSFKSRIIELSVNGEFYPLYYLNPVYQVKRLSPFIGAGIGIFHFNPKASLNGSWVDLKPLHLEGQGFPEYPKSKNYKLMQFYIPLSAGIKYHLDDQFALSLSAIFRKTFSDYLDDVSQTYIDPAFFDKYLSPEKAALARKLYNRSRSTQPVKIGSNRAYSQKKDSYTTVLLSLSYVFKHRDVFNK